MTYFSTSHPLRETVSGLLRPSRIVFAGSVVMLFGGHPEVALVGLAAALALEKRG